MMESSVQDKAYCSDMSLDAAEPLAATATPTTQLLLLEYNGSWGEKAFEESALPEEIKAHLNTYANSRPDCKVLLIRSPRSLAEPGVRFLAVQIGEHGSQVYDFHFDGYDRLLEVDLHALFAGGYASHLRHGPVYLICTHGRRDRCCSRFGIPVYNALLEAAHLDDEGMGVWQCSHVGGHRFAANFISLRSGILYGRVRFEDVAEILAAEKRGEIRLQNVRGRLAYPQPAQAAEIEIRRRFGEPGLNALHLETLEQKTSESWLARFTHLDGRRFRVGVTIEKLPTRVFESCSMDKTTPLVRYSLDVDAL